MTRIGKAFAVLACVLGALCWVLRTELALRDKQIASLSLYRAACGKLVSATERHHAVCSELMSMAEQHCATVDAFLGGERRLR